VILKVVSIHLAIMEEHGIMETMRMKRNDPERVAIYARVSTDEQAGNGVSQEQQPDLVQIKLDAEFGPTGYTIVLNEQDAGFSGSFGPTIADLGKPPSKGRKYRNGLRSILKAIESKSIDVLAVYDLSRLYRRAEALMQLFDFTARNGVRIVSVMEDVKLDTAAGELAANVLAVIAQFSRKQSNERIKSNLGQIKNEGRWLGTAPFGWTRTPPYKGAPKTIYPVPEQLAVVRRIKDLYLQGIREQAIADRLNAEGIKHILKKTDGIGGFQEKAWDWQSISNILKCCANAGSVRLPDGTYKEGVHFKDRAYEPEDFERIVETMAAKRSGLRSVPKDRDNNLLSALVRCGTCGQTLLYSKGGVGEKRAYVCRGFRGRGDYHVYVSADTLERAVFHEMELLSSDPKILQLGEVHIKSELAKVAESADRIRDLERESLKLERQKEKALDMSRNDFLTNEDLKDMLARIRKDQGPIAEELSKLRQSRDSHRTYESKLRIATKALKEFSLVWEHLGASEKRELLRLSIERAVVNPHETHNVLALKLGPFDEHCHDLPRTTAAHGKAHVTGIKALTLREMAALKWVLDGVKPGEAASRMGIGAGTYSALVKRATLRIGAADPKRAAKKAAEWIKSVEHLLPIGPWRAKRRSSPNDLTVFERIVTERYRNGETLEKIAEEMGLTVQEIEDTLRSAKEKETDLGG